ncbi:hypothetical protein AB0N56_16470 [Streptomyces microflavus]|uniref:hypothetical protein n=1 Tax=Streptomyces microflavus TaxID=1919 RepID=UPI0034365713
MGRLVEIFGIIVSRDLPLEVTKAAEEEWRALLPQWFVDRFAPDLTESAARSWGRRWRWASLAKRRSMEAEAGWEIGEWLYWFSRQNDMWRLLSFRKESSNVAILQIESADSYFPSKALEWTVQQCDAVVVDLDD